MDINQPLEETLEEVEDAAQEVVQQEWVPPLTRMGYAARGLLYLIMGALSIQVALLGHGDVKDQEGVIATLAAQPLGRILLVLVSLGLFGYGVWGLLRALADPLGKGRDIRGLMKRLAYAISGASYLLLLIPTWRYITGTLSASQEAQQAAQTRQVTAVVLAFPWGPWIVGLVGMGFFVASGVNLFNAWKGLVRKRLERYRLTEKQMGLALTLARLGLAARGVSFALVGLFLVQAALEVNPNEVKSLDEALQALLYQPYGAFLLGIVAAGLVAYGSYSLLEAAWFRLLNQPHT